MRTVRRGMVDIMPGSHALLSPSAAERWLNCTPAPRLEAELPESTSPYAAEGTLAHSVCELVARKKFTVLKPSAYNTQMKKLKADPLWNDEMTATANTYVEHLLERHMAFANDPYIVFEVRVDISDYVPEAHGTCDCVMIGGDELVITDYKHGKGVPVSPENNPQMMLYALGALKRYRPLYGDTIKNVSVYIDQPRLGLYYGHFLTVEELLAWGETTVKPKAQLAFMGKGDFNPGDHCHFCRAKARCRTRADTHTALEDFRDALLPTPENSRLLDTYRTHGMTPPPLLTDDEVGDPLTRGKSLVDWYDSLRDYALATCLEGGTIPGWKAVEGRSVRLWADQDAALAAVLDAGYPRELVYDTVPKTLAQLEKMIGNPRFTELAGGLIAKPALAPASDKRPAYNSAAADFSEVQNE